MVEPARRPDSVKIDTTRSILNQIKLGKTKPEQILDSNQIKEINEKGFTLAQPKDKVNSSEMFEMGTVIGEDNTLVKLTINPAGKEGYSYKVEYSDSTGKAKPQSEAVEGDLQNDIALIIMSIPALIRNSIKSNKK